MSELDTAQALEAIVGWWVRDQRELPWRSSRDPYAIWVSEVMSAQTSVTRAAAYWVRWMERWPTVGQLADASLADVLELWHGLGYPRRARDLHRAARIISTSGWPEDLTELPGVGPYVAAAVACFAHEHPLLPLDVNVRRVLRRRFPVGVDISADPWQSGQALMEFGQRVCVSRPRCGRCPAGAGCAGPGGDTPTPRRQPRFEGSLRQRRGELLARVIRAGSVHSEDADPDVAASLLADGLIISSDGRLRAPR